MTGYGMGDIVAMKKPHPCGCNEWKIMRLGADIRIKCVNCGRMVMIPRVQFEKKLRKILVKNIENSTDV